MARHGSLSLLAIRSGRCRADRGWTCALILLWMLCGGIVHGNTQAESPPIDAHFRLQWPTDSNRQDWVRVEVVSLDRHQPVCTISEIRNRSQSLLSTGAFHSSDDQRVITFRPRGELTDGGVDFRIRASMDAQLKIQVVDRSKCERPNECFELPPGNLATTISVKDLLSGEPFESQEGGATPSDSTWSLQRVENDQVKIELDRSDAIYDQSAASDLSIRIRVTSALELAGQNQQFNAAVYRVADDTVVARDTWSTTVDPNGNTSEIIWKRNVPVKPGVYEIRCDLKQSESRIWPRLMRHETPVMTGSRSFVVVPSTDQVENTDAREWREIALIRPTDGDRSGLNQWLPGSASRLNPLATQTINNDHFDRGQHAGEAVAIIGPNEPFETSLATLVPGAPQKVTLRYPAIPNVRLRIQVIHPNGKSSPDFVLSEGTSEATNRPWHQPTFAYYPGDGVTRIRVTNLSQNESAMIESISVHAGPAQIRSSDIRNPYRADADQRLAIYSVSSFDWVESFTHDIDSTRLASRYHPSTVSLHRLMIATKRLDDYLRSAGMTGVVLPALTDQHAWYEPSVMKPTRSENDIDPIKLKLCLRLLESSPLRVYAGIQTSATLSDVESWINEHADQITGVIRDSGEVSAVSRRYARNFESYNPLHSVVQGSIVTMTAELDEELRSHKNYAGVSLKCAGDSHLSPLQNTCGFDELTLQRFAASPLVADENVPLSPALARAWSAKDDQQRFAKWKTSQLCGLYRLISDGVQGKTLMRFSVDPDNRDIHSSLVEYRVESAVSVSADETTKSNLVVLNDIRRVPAGSLPSRIRLEKQISTSGYAKKAAKSDGKVDVGFCIGDSRFENASGEQVEPLDDAFDATLRDRTTIDVAQILEKENPEILMFDSSSVMAIINQKLSQLLSDWVNLPIDSVMEVNPPDPTAATARLRFGRVGDKYFLMAINLAPWQSDMVLQTSTALTWRQTGGSSGATTGTADGTDRLENNGLRMRLRMQPQQVVVLQADATQPNVQILDWYVRAHGGKDQLDEIAGQVSKIVDRLGGLADPPAYESLSNGSFESESSVGLVGWLHAQHPPGAVRIDNNEAIDGARSVVLSTEHSDGDRTWLVSEMIQPPRSGRLAVSLACRAAMSNTNATHRLRVSIEGTRAGEPIRQSAEIEIPQNGQWRPRQLVLEVEGVDPSSVDLLRLTIDSLSKGRVWIDDVRLHDWFPVSKERSELQGEAYVAVQGLQRGNLTPAARLLQNEWAQHLLKVKEPAPPDVIEAAKPEETSAGVAERLRNWLPAPLRF